MRTKRTAMLVNGEVFKTLQHACNNYGINLVNVMNAKSRLDQSFTLKKEDFFEKLGRSMSLAYKEAYGESKTFEVRKEEGAIFCIVPREYYGWNERLGAYVSPITGKRYETFYALAKSAGLSDTLLKYRIERLIPLKEAMEKEKRKPAKTKMENAGDLIARLEFHKISLIDYEHAIESGMTKEQIFAAPRAFWKELENKRRLLPPVSFIQWGYDPETDTFVDHEGNHYGSKLEMARAWKKMDTVVSYRLSRGASLKDALTLESFKQKTHGKNEALSCFGWTEKGWQLTEGEPYFETVKRMCAYYGMTVTWWKTGRAHGYEPFWLVAKAPKLPTKEAPISMDGKKMATIGQVFSLFGIGDSTVFLKIMKDQRGGKVTTFEEALSFCYERKYGKKVVATRPEEKEVVVQATGKKRGRPRKVNSTAFRSLYYAA